MVNVAAIDIGTNTVRLLVSDGAGNELAREVDITRLGQGVDRTRMLSPDGIARTLAVLERYHAIIQRHQVTKIRVVATSAARDAHNRDDFFRGVERALGARAELLPGNSEAALSFAGATLGRTQDARPSVVVDIGGGSTELALGHGEPERTISLDIGSVRLSERFFRSDPPLSEETELASKAASVEFERARSFLGDTTTARFIGVAGTVTTVAAFCAGLRSYDASVTHDMKLHASDVERAFDRFRVTPLEERRSLLIEPKRAEAIVGGSLLLHGIFRCFGLSEMIVSERDILDALAASLRS
jgi:exopolyphosphatase/guanosine-5'-triphosphate,3'-diphosphate pyrophosphatase